MRPALPARRLVRGLADLAVRGSARGRRTADFEGAFAAALGTSEAVALPSVRLGLRRSLEFLRFPPASTILCTPLTVYPVIEAIRRASLRIRLVDVEPGSFCMDADAARAALSPDVRALLVTHLWGVPGDIGSLAQLAADHDLVLIEDASQCMGGEYGGRKVGTFGRVGLFSLGLTKTVTALSGAALVTDDRALGAELRAAASNLGATGRMDLARAATTALVLRAMTRPSLYRRGGSRIMDRMRRAGPAREGPGGEDPALQDGAGQGFGDRQADLALDSLRRFDGEYAHRGRISQRYRTGLGGLAGLEMAEIPADRRPGHWAFAVLHPRAADLQARLRAEGIDAVPSSVDACHELSGAPELRTPLPVASRLQRDCTCLPLHGTMSDAEVHRVIRAVRAFCGGG